MSSSVSRRAAPHKTTLPSRGPKRAARRTDAPSRRPSSAVAGCNVIALPSTGKEGLPNVLLEALAMEKPCVATAKYGMPEVVLDGVTGYTFPSGDVDALAEAIVKIGGVPAGEQAKMAQAGKEMVFAEHDKVKQFEKILEIIKEKARASL